MVPTYTPVVPVLPTETAVPLLLVEVIVPLLNIRTGPGTDYELLFTVNEGDELELIGRTSDGSWWQICCVNDEVGWVIGEAVQLPPNALDRAKIVTVPTLQATSPEN